MQGDGVGDAVAELEEGFGDGAAGDGGHAQTGGDFGLPDAPGGGEFIEGGVYAVEFGGGRDLFDRVGDLARGVGDAAGEGLLEACARQGQFGELAGPDLPGLGFAGFLAPPARGGHEGGQQRAEPAEQDRHAEQLGRPESQCHAADAADELRECHGAEPPSGSLAAGLGALGALDAARLGPRCPPGGGVGSRAGQHAGGGEDHDTDAGREDHPEEDRPNHDDPPRREVSSPRARRRRRRPWGAS